MLRTNLATRPFYNERIAQVALGVVAVLGVAILAAGVVRLVDLARRNGDLNARADQAARTTADLAARATEAQRAVTPQELTALADATREANTLITQRLFSWTDFFNRIETTLPPDVMVTEVRPEIEPGVVEVAMGVLGRRLDSVNRFVTSLETSGAFIDVLNRQVELTEDGMYRAILRGRYLESARLDVDAVDGSGEGDRPADGEEASSARPASAAGPGGG